MFLHSGKPIIFEKNVDIFRGTGYNNIIISGFKLSMTGSYKPPQLKLSSFLMCTVENSSHFHPEEVVEFYRGSEDVIGMAQWDKCFQVFSQYPLKYDGICDKGTNRRLSSVKKYILRIHKVSTMDQRDWHCQLKVDGSRSSDYTLTIHGMFKLNRDEGRKEGNVLFNDALTHFIYGYMVSDIWLWTILIVRKETRCHHTGYSF